MKHLVCLSFEHRVGNQIDAVYPPFSDRPHINYWNQGLPFVGIPDKAHGACSSVIQFTLPNGDLETGHSYGIAAYRSIETSSLQKTDPSYIRGHVQRSLCVISDIPLFGELEAPLKTLLYDRFDSLVDSIQEMYQLLFQLTTKPSPFSGVSYNSLFQNLQYEVLTVAKALFMNHSVLIFAENSELVSKMVIALGSLLPGFIYNESYPLKFLGKSYSFAPYVPLQFTETLNSSSSHSKLMGTCSELFMDRKVVDYDILIDCRSVPAIVKGKRLNYSRITDIEYDWMKGILKEMKLNWQKPQIGDWIREQFLKWSNSLLTSLGNTRNIHIVPEFIWPYLDWKKSYDVFGEEFVLELINNPCVHLFIKEYVDCSLKPIDESLSPKKNQISLKFWK